MTTTVASDDRWMTAARVKLHRISGPERGEQLLQQALAELGLRGLSSAEELFALAEHLVTKGGFTEAIGYALQFQATLHGARGRSAAPPR